VDSTNQPYLFPEYQQTEALVETEPRDWGLSKRRVLLHVLLFGATCVTTTITGAVMITPSSVSSWGYTAIVRSTLDGDFMPLANGLLFTFTLLMILGSHELGHYFACRYYGIRATLPFFIPAPPAPFTPFGTFGAVIKIKDPITSRRALFDIGIAGPLAGFVFALPASIIGLLVAESVIPSGGEGLVFNDPPLFLLIIKVFGLPASVRLNPVILAAWGALLVTALNLFPVGQLDGGHVLYAVVGPRIHKWVSRLVCVAVAALAITAQVTQGSPIWFLWTLVLIFMARVGHPPTRVSEPLGKGRLLLAAVALLVFLLCFMPFPITME
jgi:membrane-associated protease RseP (regulator of RpoE activity)